MSFSIEINYDFDTSGFFDAAAMAAMEAAADIWEGLIGDEFEDVPAGLSFDITNPATGGTTTYTTTAPIDDLLIFVGARDLGGSLGLGGPTGTSLGGMALGDAFERRVSPDFRGTGPVTDAEPWAGTIAFDADADWSFDLAGPEAGLNDFLTTALHEIGHVLGFGTLPAFFAQVSGGTFTGPNAPAETGGAGVPLDGTDHVEDGFMGDEVLMDPTTTVGTRKLPTDIDLAIFADIGYEIAGFTAQGSQPPLATEGGELIFGTALADEIDGLGGADTVQGGEGDDTLAGGAGSDTLFGQAGDDRLEGASGDDQLQGGSGDDTLTGGAGDDLLIGGSGADVFLVAPGDDGATIDGFEFGTDLIRIEAGFPIPSEAALIDAIEKPFANVSRIVLDGSTFVDVFHAPQSGTPVTAADIELLGAMPLDPPDLTVTALAADPTDWADDAVVMVTGTVANGGELPAIGVEVEVVLTDDGTLGDADDRTVATLALSGRIEPGAARDFSTTIEVADLVAAGLMPGVLDLVAIADPQDGIAESDEGNNASAPVRVELLDAPAPDRPDLGVSNLAASATAWTGGGTVAVSGTLENDGPGAVSGATVRLYLSDDPVIGDADDIAIGDVVLSGTVGGRTETPFSTAIAVQALLDAGIDPGSYRLGAIADPDDAVDETDEGDNGAIGPSVTLAERVLEPNLTAGALTLSREDWEDGDTVTISGTLSNPGEVPVSDPVVEIALSADGTLGNAEDITLAVQTLPGTLAAGGSAPFSAEIAVGALLAAEVAPGAYAIAAIADPTDAVAENDETDNTGPARTVALLGEAVPDRPDLRATDVTVSETDWTFGTTVTVAGTIVNGGAVAAEVAGLRVVLSADEIIGNGDDLGVATLSVPGGVPAEGEVAFSAAIGVTALLTGGLEGGDYRLAAVADPFDAVAESNETNNASALFDIVVIEPEPMVIEGTDGDDAGPEGAIRGTALDEIVDAGAGDDVIVGSGGDDTIEGGDGTDRVVYFLNRDDLVVTLDTVDTGGGLGTLNALAGTISVAKPNGRMDVLSGIERIDLRDGDYLYDIDSEFLSLTYRLYAAAFARTPDEAGLRFWVDQLDQGFGDRDAALAFVVSQEFADRYGEDPTVEEYVAALYDNVLARGGEIDEAGREFWTEALTTGQLDEADMLRAFANSQENRDQSAMDLDNGVWVTADNLML